MDRGLINVRRLLFFSSLEPLQWTESIFGHALTIVLNKKVTLKDTFLSKSVAKVDLWMAKRLSDSLKY